MLKNNYCHMSQHTLASYIKALWHTVSLKSAISGGWEDAICGANRRDINRSPRAHIPTRGSEKPPSAAAGGKEEWQLTLHCSEAQQSSSALIRNWYYSNKARRWHFPQWHFRRLPQWQTNNKKNMQCSKSTKVWKRTGVPHSPFCPLCRWWGCWSPWSCWGPECPSSRSCPLSSCRQWRPYQIKRCAWKEQDASVTMWWCICLKLFHFPRTDGWNLGWVIQ